MSVDSYRQNTPPDRSDTRREKIMNLVINVYRERDDCMKFHFTGLSEKRIHEIQSHVRERIALYYQEMLLHPERDTFRSQVLFVNTAFINLDCIMGIDFTVTDGTPVKGD